MLYFQLSQKDVPPPLLVNDKVQWASGGGGGARRKSDTIFVERENDALL